MEQIKKYLKLAGNLVMYILVFYAVFAFYVYVYNHLPIGEGPLKDWLSKNFLVTFITNDLTGLLVLYLIFKIKKKSLIQECNFSPISVKSLAASLGFGIAMGFFTTSLTNVDYIQKTLPELGESIEFLIGGSPVVFLFVLIINSTYKEVLFRGAIFNELRKNINIVLAVIIQGVIYGCVLFGINMPLRFYGFAGAALFGLAYLFAGSIQSPILVQVACTGTLFILGKTVIGQLVNGGSAVPLLVLSVLAMAFSLLYLWKDNRQKTGKGAESYIKG